MEQADLAIVAKLKGHETEAQELDHQAFDNERQAADLVADTALEPTRSVLHRSAATLALRCGEVSEAIRLIDQAIEGDPPDSIALELEDLANQADRPDSWLITAIRGKQANRAALQVLLLRHWRALYRYCYRLTWDLDKALDLAQEAALRLIKARQTLNPGGTIQGFLIATARNVWLDQLRHAARAGALAAERLESLNQPGVPDKSEGTPVSESVADPRQLDPEDAILRRMAVGRAMRKLSPEDRELVIAYHVENELLAEIAERHGVTSQAAGVWVRRATTRLQSLLEEEWGK